MRFLSSIIANHHKSCDECRAINKCFFCVHFLGFFSNNYFFLFTSIWKSILLLVEEQALMHGLKTVLLVKRCVRNWHQIFIFHAVFIRVWFIKMAVEIRSDENVLMETVSIKVFFHATIANMMSRRLKRLSPKTLHKRVSKLK